MDSLERFALVTSDNEPAARCLVCGNEIPAGDGITVRSEEETLRFRCLGCMARFEADPARYLSDHATDGCRMVDAECPPMSEWST
jgi:hypothetical protein